jgi:hypothetical protein
VGGLVVAESNRRAGRFRQFGLRSLLGVVLLVALPCAWYAAKVQEYNHEVATVATFNSLNLSFHWKSVGPHWLRSWSTLHRVGAVVAYIDSKKEQVDDDVLPALAELHYIDTLSLDGTNITDRGLRSLARFEHLRDLDLTATRITDAGLTELLVLRQLEVLGLGFMAPEFGGPAVGVTDAGICRLAELPNLRALSLYGTNVSDKTATALEQCTRLQFVDFRDTNVSEEAADHLRQSRPNLAVLHD